MAEVMIEMKLNCAVLLTDLDTEFFTSWVQFGVTLHVEFNLFWLEVRHQRRVSTDSFISDGYLFLIWDESFDVMSHVLMTVKF